MIWPGDISRSHAPRGNEPSAAPRPVAVPRDPYSSSPLQYSRQREVVWSVGPFGRGRGKADQPTRIGPELFWRVSEGS